MKTKFQWYLLENVQDFQSLPSKPSYLPKALRSQVEKNVSAEVKLPTFIPVLPWQAQSRADQQDRVPKAKELVAQE